MKKQVFNPYVICCCLFVLSFLFTQAQDNRKPADKVAAARSSGRPFVPVAYRAATGSVTTFNLDQQVREGTLFAAPPVTERQVQESSPVEMQLPLPGGRSVTLELVPVNIFTSDFSIRASDGNRLEAPLALHYQGIIKGVPGSLAAISLFEDEVAGFFSSAEGSYVVGKLRNMPKGTPAYNIVYTEKDVTKRPAYTCFTDDSKMIPLPAATTTAALTTNCVRMFFETEYDLYTAFGNNYLSVAGYVGNLFNQVKTLYNNDGVNVGLSQILMWITTDPYTGASSSSTLSQFQSNRTVFNGDIAQLLTTRNTGGGLAATINGVCGTMANRMCMSGNLATSFANLPTYSWEVNVTTHEFGHLLGSRHTHACVWNGNNTAIDGCGPTAGYSEGACPIAAIPPGGGTIMSYCHLNAVGINPSLGFGAQPAQVIRNVVNAAGCLGSNCGLACGGAPTGSTIAITANINGKYVTSNSGTAAMIANKTTITQAEKFEVVNAGSGYVYLKAIVNNKYVSAENAGTAPLIANRTTAGPWEQFCWINNGDGTFSLNAQVNGGYVVAENAGASSLYSNRAAIGPWEKFTYQAVMPRLAKGAGEVEEEPAVTMKPVLYPNPAKNVITVSYYSKEAGTVSMSLLQSGGIETAGKGGKRPKPAAI